ncbi:hypothetical protein GGX14DRAFT_627360 [Mycena pura]|uniref:Uncharacterized protein n=1 Tax=Mycena pura TaxID=153505 RepID=A0AAD6YR47_9AGAR|nr:hypothetical protein GGX14DRAFT_627360 [Mycena pura]
MQWPRIASPASRAGPLWLAASTAAQCRVDEIECADDDSDCAAARGRSAAAQSRPIHPHPVLSVGQFHGWRLLSPAPPPAVAAPAPLLEAMVPAALTSESSFVLPVTYRRRTLAWAYEPRNATAAARTAMPTTWALRQTRVLSLRFACAYRAAEYPGFIEAPPPWARLCQQLLRSYGRRGSLRQSILHTS